MDRKSRPEPTQLVMPVVGHDLEPTANRTRPFLKWAGGKAWLAPFLATIAPAQFGKYIEPFAGSAAVYFYLRPKKAVLGDSNPELINCYRVVRDKVDELVATLSSYPYSREFYYELRARVCGSDVERAARFIYLNRTCYNGLYRVNKDGVFNVPFGRYANPIICDEQRLRTASEALKGVTLVDLDYQETLRRYARSGDFVYIDPPYQPVSRYSDFKRYTKEFFYEDDQVRLAEVVGTLVRRGCHVIVSNSDTEFVRRLYKDLAKTIYVVRANRFINKDPAGRKGINELVIVCQPK